MDNKAKDINHKYQHLFATPFGEEVLKDLCDQFVNRTMATGDAHSTVVNAAQCDVIRYIQDRIEDARNE